MRAQLAVDAHDGIGEGPLWDAARQRLLWSDNTRGVIHAAQLEAGAWSETHRWELARPIGAVIPRAGGGLIAVGGTDIFTLDEAGQSTHFARLDADPEAVSFNDAKCDPLGRLWAGTQSHGFERGRGALYRIDPDRTVTVVRGEVTISNGLDWSADGRTFYYTDSMTRTVEAYDFDLEHGTISNPRPLITIEQGRGGPDGLTVDAEGCLWVAVFSTGEVRRYSPSGVLLSTVDISAPAVTSCAFGGRDLSELFITSAGVPLPEFIREVNVPDHIIASAHTAPGAGGLFVCRPGARGRLPTFFAG